MIPDTLDGVLWLARHALRTQWSTVNASHGFADPQYRPPALPWVSVVGPLAVEVEPERDGTAPEPRAVLLPGFVVGVARTAESAPGGSTLTLTVDGDATADVVVADPLDLSSDVAARAACAAVQAAVRAAAFQDADGAPIIDPDRVAELARITCAFDAASRRVVLASGRYGEVDDLRIASTVSVDPASDLAAPLGLVAPTRRQPGRYVRRPRRPSKGFAVDLRVDLWAATQRDLADLLDAFNRLVPTRGTLAVRPALLAEDAAPGDTQVVLLDAGEPTSAASVLHLEAGDGTASRVGPELTLTGGTADASGILLDGTETAFATLFPRPLVPDPRRPSQPWPGGLALSLGVELDAGLAGAFRLVRITHDGSTVLSIEGSTGGGGPNAFVELDVRCDFDGGTASTVRRIPRDVALAGLDLHVVAVRGGVHVQLGSDAQDLADGDVTPSPPVRSSGVLAGGDDVLVELGHPGGNPAPFRFTRLNLHAEPVFAPDPRARTSVAAASRFLPGDPLVLAAGHDGLPAADSESRRVVSVSGSTVTLDRPLERGWSRAATLVHSRRYFFHQRQAKRKDDLMNHLFRYALTWRVSALLEPRVGEHTGALALEPVIDLVPLGAAPPASGAPGTSPIEAVPTV